MITVNLVLNTFVLFTIYEVEYVIDIFDYFNIICNIYKIQSLWSCDILVASI